MEQSKNLGGHVPPVPPVPPWFLRLCIATGCDFTSFFVGIGKTALLKGFFRFSDFITGQFPTLPCTLAHTDPESNGFLAFLHLVGVAYYLKNQGAFLKTHQSATTILKMRICDSF